MMTITIVESQASLDSKSQVTDEEELESARDLAAQQSEDSLQTLDTAEQTSPTDPPDDVCIPNTVPDWTVD